MNVDGMVWASLWMPNAQRFMTYDEVQEQRAALRSATNQACEQAMVEIGLFTSEAINWADLGCAECGIHDTGWYVVIEEAAPNAIELQTFIRRWLADHGYRDVQVATEW